MTKPNGTNITDATKTSTKTEAKANAASPGLANAVSPGPAPPVEAAPAEAVIIVEPKPKKALPVVKPSMGMQAMKMDPIELDEAVALARVNLESLMHDDKISVPVKASLEALIALASSAKPGMEEMQTAWKVTRMSIAQPTTRSEMKPEDARPGDIYTSAGQLLTKPWTGIPLYFFEENVNFPEGSKNPICTAPDAKLGSPFGECVKCPHLPFGKQPGGFDAQKKTDCQSNIVSLMLAHDLSGLYIVQFGKTSRKAGSVMLQLAGQQQRVWKQSYSITTEKKTNEVGLYYIYKTEATGKDNPDDVCRVAEAFYGLYIAERKRMLAEYYNRPAKASSVAAEAEAEFAGSALEAGLAGVGDGEEPDLSTPTARAGASARNTTKPM